LVLSRVRSRGPARDDIQAKIGETITGTTPPLVY
jgi:hypothetical protein